MSGPVFRVTAIAVAALFPVFGIALVDSGGPVSLFGGSHNRFPPSVNYAGSSGKGARCKSTPPISSTTPTLWAAVCMCRPTIR